MRPLRLLLSLCSCLIAITLLLYIALGFQQEVETQHAPPSAKQSRLKALFSFTSPGSLFPPSAIISLTDDNSTFFLARPAAFGPLLPSKGLSGPLWIGSGFGDDAMGKGELGCSDVPGWDGGDDNVIVQSEVTSSAKSKVLDTLGTAKGSTRRKRAQAGDIPDALGFGSENDGTDDYLHKALPASTITKSLKSKSSEHADIQSLQEGAEIAGKVVLLKRGGCGFLEKVKWAQRRGGVALIVGDDVRGGGLVRMYAHGDTSNVTIPALFTSHTTAHLLSSLLPSGGIIQDLSPEDAAKLTLIKSGKDRKNSKNQDKTRKKQDTSPTSSATQATSNLTPSVQGSDEARVGKTDEHSSEPLNTSWFRSFLHALGFGKARRTTRKEDNRRPPSSGNLDWVLVENWDDDQEPVVTKSVMTASTPTIASDNFVIGEQDWRDPDLLPKPASTALQAMESTPPDSQKPGEIIVPGSGEYTTDGPRRKGSWWSKLFGSSKDDTSTIGSKYPDGSSDISSPTTHSNHDENPDEPEEHEGLWVTLTPTNMSTSPFFDTLLVLVVSPLVTLTVVYALLLLRSRIRRRRWRAPKSVVDRLPVRTYHTITDANSSPTATPNASSPTTPLLQHPPSRPTSSPTSSLSRPRSRTTSEVPATSSSFQQNSRTREEEKRESGLAEWRRRYGGRQKECVVCLEEYEDGISRVMSLPCGHEFHVDCITPWLVTRRRTCPICKGDVVRSLSQSYHDRTLHSPSPTRSRIHDELDDVQAEAVETRNDSLSASMPVPIASSSTVQYTDSTNFDLEANWLDDGVHEEGREIPRERVIDLSSSMRDLSSTVSTTIWRGFDAVRSAAGLQRRPSPDGVDRDR